MKAIIAPALLLATLLTACAETPPARTYGGTSGASGGSALPPPGSAPRSGGSPALGSGSSPPSGSPSAAPSSTTSASSGSAGPQGEKYGRDRTYCQAQANDQMKTRRTVDYGRSEVFQGQMDRYGTAALPDRMADYSDTRKFDSYYGDCMASRGWTNEDPIGNKWWNRGIKF